MNEDSEKEMDVDMCKIFREKRSTHGHYLLPSGIWPMAKRGGPGSGALRMC